MATKRRKTRKATKARRAPRKVARRKPMSAAARKAFRERMEAARAAKGNKTTRPTWLKGNRNFVGPMLRAPDARTGREPTARHVFGPSASDTPKQRATRAHPNVKRSTQERSRFLSNARYVGPQHIAATIVEILKGAGYGARYFIHSDNVEVVTDAPDAVCIEAARAAGA